MNGIVKMEGCETVIEDLRALQQVQMVQDPFKSINVRYQEVDQNISSYITSYVLSYHRKLAWLEEPINRLIGCFLVFVLVSNYNINPKEKCSLIDPIHKIFWIRTNIPLVLLICF